jgi:transposase
MTQDRTTDWQELCKKAANELDPVKLMQLIAELTKALDERNNRRSNGLDRGDETPPSERSLQSAF